MLAEGFVERDLFARVHIPKAPRLVKPTLSDEGARGLLAVASAGKRNGRRDEALLFFMLDTGAQAGEVCGLWADAIAWERRLARLYDKGRKQHNLPFSAATDTASQRCALRSRRATSGCVIELEDGRPLTVSGPGQICERLAKRAGVKIYPHMARHTLSLAYLRSCCSAFDVQKTLGHTTLDTNLRHLAMVTDDLIAEHQEHSPVTALVVVQRRNTTGRRRDDDPSRCDGVQSLGPATHRLAGICRSTGRSLGHLS